jgi:hypothetical protein
LNRRGAEGAEGIPVSDLKFFVCAADQRPRRVQRLQELQFPEGVYEKINQDYEQKAM